MVFLRSISHHLLYFVWLTLDLLYGEFSNKEWWFQKFPVSLFRFFGKKESECRELLAFKKVNEVQNKSKVRHKSRKTVIFPRQISIFSVFFASVAHACGQFSLTFPVKQYFWKCELTGNLKFRGSVDACNCTYFLRPEPDYF